MIALLAAHQLRYELRAFWRTPQAVFFTVALPLVMLTVFATLNEDIDVPTFAGRSYAAFFVPGMLTFGVVSATYGNLAVRTVFRRETGQLKRLRATPLPAASYLAGAVANAVLVALSGSVAVLAVGRFRFDVALPGRWWLAGAVLLLAAICFSALGLACSTFIGRPEAADPTVFGTMLPVVFISNVFQAVPEDSSLARVSRLLPVRPTVDAIRAVYLDLPISRGGLAVIVLWAVVGALIAARRMRWAPS